VTCTLLLGAHCVTCTLLLGLPILYFLVPRPPLWVLVCWRTLTGNILMGGPRAKTICVNERFFATKRDA
jgi:hypothetical protein